MVVVTLKKKGKWVDVWVNVSEWESEWMSECEWENEWVSPWRQAEELGSLTWHTMKCSNMSSLYIHQCVNFSSERGTSETSIWSRLKKIFTTTTVTITTITSTHSSPSHHHHTHSSHYHSHHPTITIYTHYSLHTSHYTIYTPTFTLSPSHYHYIPSTMTITEAITIPLSPP